MATIAGAVLEVGGGYRAVQGTITTDLQQYYGSVTWNAGGVTFTAMLLDITSTASAADSLIANFRVGGASKWKLGKGGDTTQTGTAYIGDTSNVDVTLGLTINQAGADDQILALKSTDVAHGITGVAETDTFAFLQKGSATNGGLVINGLSAGTFGIEFRGTLTTDEATRSNAALGAFIMNALKKSGTSAAGLAADRNMIVFQNNGTTRHILDSDGDSHQDVGTAWTNFDTHNDIALLNRLSAHVTRMDDPLRGSFHSWLEESRDDLTRLGLVTFNADGHHFVNMSRLQMLTVGAVRQLADRLSQIEQKLLPAT